MNPSSIQFNLYLDDSGQFKETTYERQKNPGGFSSQLAGFLTAPNQAESYISTQAKKIIENCCNEAGIPVPPEIHAAEITSDEIFNTIIHRLIYELKLQSWQPLRLVNKEGVKYGDRIATYTNMVAELLRRIFQQKSKEFPHTPLIIKLTSDQVWLGDKHIERHLYWKRIDEYIGRAAVWHGLAKEASLWSVEKLETVDSRLLKEIQICDLLSSASKGKRDFQRCDYTTKTSLKKAFDVYDYSMMTRDVLDRVDVFIKSYSYGLALITLAEILHDKQFSTNNAVEIKAIQLLNDTIEHLVKVNTRGRDPQLTIIINWLDQLIGQQRTLEHGYQLAKWLQEHVEEKLRNKLISVQDKSSLDWFKFALHRWALTAANHLGAVNKSQAESSFLSAVAPLLANRFEHSSLLIDGFIAQAVYQTDCFDFDSASFRMKEVIKSLEALSKVFPNAMPKDFSGPIQFELKGRALGTLMQSEVLASQGDHQRLDRAREINNAAISEFSSNYDRARQYQYRSQLETIAGQFEQARFYLAKSLLMSQGPKPADYSHQSLAKIIESFSDTPPRFGFALLHWLRIGAALCLSTDINVDIERQDFLKVFNDSRLKSSTWCMGKEGDYPAHGILRRTAVIYAYQDNSDDALSAIKLIHELDPFGKDHLVLAAILLAAQAEVAGLLYPNNPSSSQALLDNSNLAYPGLAQMLINFLGKTKELPTMQNVFKKWVPVIDKILKNNLASEVIRKDLVDLAKVVGF